VELREVGASNTCGVDYLYFDESYLVMVITPDLKSQGEIKAFFKHNWSSQPKVEVYPS
jgi:hypothetical protein